MGGGKGGSTTVNKTEIPPEVLARYNAVNARAETVAQQPYQRYSNDPNAFVAGLTPTQMAGIQNVNTMAGAAQPYYGAATQQLGQGQQQGQGYLGAATGQLGAAQQTGQALGATAGEQYAQAANVAAPYYQAATANLGAGLGLAAPLNLAAAQSAFGAAGAAAPYYGAATRGTQAAIRGAQPYQGAATQAALAGSQAVSPGQLQTAQFLNPYTQNVVAATQAALGQQFGQQQAQQQAEAIRAGAFGGDRSGLQRAQLRGQQALAESQAIAPLYQQAYQNALQTAQQQQGVNLSAEQANRAALQGLSPQLAALGQQGYGQQLGAAQQMAGLGQALYGQGMTGAQTLSQLGQTGFGQQLSAAQQAAALGQGLYGQALGLGQAIQGLGQQQYGQGAQTAQQLAALGQQGYGMGAGTSSALANLGTNAQQAGLAGAQAQLQAGQQQQQTEQAGKQAMYNQFMQEQGYPFQVAQFLANIATGTGALSGNQSTSTTTGGGGFFSDERLKENIKKVGETNDGQPIYRYNYKGDPRTQIGLMAQDVEKEHPEAVGLAGGYKTVDYKKATEDAVHKADGGGTTDAYSMDAPSQMLNKPAGLGALTLPQMRTEGIAVRSMTPASEITGLLAPKATGFSPGTMEGKRAELSSLKSSIGRASDLGSGPGYMNDRMAELEKFLAANASQGGFVGPEGGSFSRGGYAFGGGPYGVQLEQIAQRPMMQAQPGQRPAERNALAEAKQIGDLASLGYAGYKNRPDFLRSDADIAARKTSEAAAKVAELQKLEWAKEKGIDVDTLLGKAHGGLIDDRDGFNTRGYVNSSSNPYSGVAGGYLDETLQSQQETPRPSLDAKGAPRPQPAKSGLGELTQLANLGKQGKSAFDWASKQLAGEASPTAMSATSTEALPGLAGGAETSTGALGAATAPAGGVIDLTTAAPGLAAAAPEALTAAAPEALGAGLLGGAAEVAAPVMTAAAEIPWFLAFLKDGGAVPHRKHYQGQGFVVPDEYSTAEPDLAGAEGGTETTNQGGDGETAVGRSAPLVRPARPVPTPENAIVATTPREPRPGVASGSRPSIPDLGGLVPEGMKDTLSSENFWVPALAGIGSMLASPNKTLAGAIGSGLVGGTTAYTNLEKQQADQLTKRIEMAKNIFSGPYKDESTGKRYWRMAGRSTPVYEDEYPDLYNKFVNGNMAGTPSSAKPVSKATTDLAKTITPERVSTPAATTGQQAPAPAPALAPITTSKKPEEAAPPAATGTAPPANAQTAPASEQAAPPAPKVEPIAARDPNELKDQILSDTSRWKDKPLFRNAPMLLQKAQEETEKATALTARAAQAGSEDTVNAKANEAALLAEAKRASDNAKTYHDATQKLVDDAAAPTIARLNANEADNVKYFNDQAAIDQARQMARMQVNAIRDIVENFESGTFAEQKAHFAGVLRSLGVPPDRIKSATFDADAFQSFTKDMMKNVFADVAKIGGQLKVAELAGLEKASANPSLQPETNQKILAQALGVLNAEDKRYRDEQEARKKLGWNYDRSAFQDEWHGKHKDIGKFVDEVGKDIAVRGATPPDWSKLKPGQAYIVEPDPAHGITAPTKLRYLGKDTQTGKHKWQKIGGG
jgi:hypothetical protein